MTINIVFPVFNEEGRVVNGIEKTEEFIKNSELSDVSITIVDNGSSDHTEELCEKLKGKYRNITYIKIIEKGVGAAFGKAIVENKCDIIGYMDIDLSTPLYNLQKMRSQFVNNNIEIVNASRYSKSSKVVGRKWYRKVISGTLIFLLKANFKMKSSDAICGFKFFKRGVAEELLEKSSNENGWFLIIEMLLRAERYGKKIYELPIIWAYDEKNSKVNVFKVTLNYLSQIIRLKKVFINEKK